MQKKGKEHNMMVRADPMVQLLFPLHFWKHYLLRQILPYKTKKNVASQVVLLIYSNF